MKGYDPYWVLLEDELPGVGSGFRQVWAKYDPGGMKVFVNTPYLEKRIKLTVDQWFNIAHVQNSGQSLSDAMTALRRIIIKGSKETCNGNSCNLTSNEA